MDESLLSPSPNWFQVSILKVTSDGYVIYGGPNKSLCILEPIPANETQIIENGQSYKTHVISRAHKEKIVSVDVSPDWLNKRYFLTGSVDGVVRRWSMDGSGKTFKVKNIQTNDYLLREKEEVVGVGHSPTGNYAVAVGCFGNVVKWDLQSNVGNANSNFLRNFKPSCMTCSPHVSIYVAVGTKQGVIFVLDLAAQGKIMYKVRGQDEEIVNISWCPNYIVTVKKSLPEPESSSRSTKTVDRISKSDDEDETSKKNDDEDETSKSGGRDETETTAGSKEDEPLSSAADKQKASGLGNKQNNDSDNDSNVAEDDMFDIYKDHAADEFGHKKYQPEDIVVKIKEKKPELDYLAECAKLRNDILQSKKEEESIESLVEAFDKTHVGESNSKGASTSKKGNTNNVRKYSMPMNEHIHKHLLASISKFGVLRVWSKTGKLVGSCTVLLQSVKGNVKVKVPTWPTILWYKPDMLLIGDGKSQLLECNPLKLDYKNKLEWRIIHSLHQRSIYCIASEVPRVFKTETEEHWPIWTLSQDRFMVKYCLKERQPIATYPTAGGFIYMIQSCPYDAGKVAMCVGDGAVRVWQTAPGDGCSLQRGRTAFYWQNVQGKVLKIAWHPTRENCLAFSTAEARVGLIDTSGRNEKLPRTLVPALNGGVYSLSWADGDQLYACGGGELVMYRTDKKFEVPERITLNVEGQDWEFSEVKWYSHGMAVGAVNGAVAVLTPTRPHVLVAASFVFNKMIYTIDWHPQKTSNSNEDSAFKNMIAVCSMDKENSVAILELVDGETTKQLTTVRMLSGHKGAIFDVAWNPHRDMQLVTASADETARVWDVATGACTHVSRGAGSVLCAAWGAFPQLPHALLTAGADFTVRLWDVSRHPADQFQENESPVINKKKLKKKVKERKDFKRNVGDHVGEINEPLEWEERLAATLEVAARPSRRFLFPMISKQINSDSINAARKLYIKHMCIRMGFAEPSGAIEKLEYDCDYLKMFGTINDVNEILDYEMQRHLDASNMEQWILISIFRGQIDTVIKFASEHDILDPFLLSIAPSVSFKYWKEVNQMYIAQIDRLQAKGEEHRLCENKHYGGAVFRRVVSQLSLHDVKGAVATLKQSYLYKEAYILCRIRHMDSIAEETLKEWAEKITSSGSVIQGAVCYLVLGNLVEAAKALSKSNVSDHLHLAMEMAKLTDQPLFAEHIEKKVRGNSSQDSDEPEANEPKLEALPLRAELLMNHSSNDEDSQSESGNNRDSGLDE